MSTIKSHYHLRDVPSLDVIKQTINHQGDHDDFKNRERAVAAIGDIVAVVQEGYCNADHQEQLINKVIKILHERPVAERDMHIGRSELSEKPLIMQVLILMQNIMYKRRQTVRLRQKLYWLAIALHTAVLLIYHGKKTHMHNILMQFKLAQFSKAATRTWIWRELPEIPEQKVDNILISLQDVSKRLAIKYGDRTQKEFLKLPDVRQINKIIASYQDAHYVKKRLKIEPNNQIKPISLANQPVLLAVNNVQNDLGSNDEHFEDFVLESQSQFYTAMTESYEGLTTTYEESIDHYDPPFISYEVTTDLPKGLSFPLQTIDLSLQQNHISQQELALNSNVRVLPKSSYQRIFSALCQDTQFSTNTSNRDCAYILLLSMITALPIKSLTIAGYIGHPSIFKIGLNRSYIHHSLGITKRQEAFNGSKYENQLDIIKIPVPQWLIDEILTGELPSDNSIQEYLTYLRAKISLPYLSTNRIETALHVVLSRYTPNSNAHIADLICRTPASQAPAMYYSSHLSEEILSHYKLALSIFNQDNHFDMSYITPWHKYTLGSGFAFTPNYVREIITELQAWADSSTDANTHFNRISIFVWFVLCLLTGVRPNNGIGLMSDIDLEAGWLMIDDKPNRKSKSHRLIPLCSTLIRLLSDYRSYLIGYQLNNLLKQEISECIDEIRLGNEIALLRLLSENFSTLDVIKRGDAYHMTKDIIDTDPYWTRHFVRTQLERLGVDMVLINAVVGHEKARQHALGRFSSLSKHQIKQVGDQFEQLAETLGLKEINIKNNHDEWSMSCS